MKKSIAIFAAAALSLAALPLSACTKDKTEISKYVINASYDKQECRLQGTTEFTFYNSTENEITALDFNLWGNAFREDAQYKPVADAYSARAYYGGASYGRQEVEKVEGCASWEVAGDDENILTVTLTEPVYPEESCTVNITFSLDLAHANCRTGVTQSTVNLGNFYPVLCAYSEEGFVKSPYYSNGDPFVSECADFEVTLSLPKGYVAATSGKEVEKKVEETCVSTKYSLENARDFAAVLSDNFKTATRTVGEVDVTMYYCGETEPARQMDAACESLEYFSATFGEYVYPTLSVVVTPLYVSGMEYPALTMISDALDESESIYTIVHENAHQWWYAMVGSDQLNCAWQDEGLAEYSTLCFFENSPSYGFTRTATLGAAIKAYRAYYSVYNQIFGKTDTSMKRHLKDFASDYEYVNIAYNKGLLAFESVRTAMGDKKFFTALKNYYNANCYKIASQEEMISHFAALHDVEGIFNSYIEGKVVI